MKKFITLTLCLIVSSVMVFAQRKAKAKAEEDMNQYNYEIVQTSVAAATGHVNLIVFTYSTKPNVAEDMTKKCAVHACIFKGLPECANKPGSGRKPLLMDAQKEAEFADFFKKFFSEGEFMRFVTISSSTPKITTVKKEYKVGKSVIVNYALLRKYLEDSGVIRSLTTGF